MKLTRTTRGFQRAEFTDRYGASYSIQESSLATEACIWLGVNEPEVKRLIPDQGWKDIELPEGTVKFGRMHLTQDMVAELLPLLQRFVETGRLDEM